MEAVEEKQITLTIPRDAKYFSIARLALSGVAVRAKLTYDDIEDLKLATDEVLELSLISDGHKPPVTLDIKQSDSHIEIEVHDLFERGTAEEELFVIKENILETKLFLLRYLVNEVRFRTIESGTYLISLIKDISPELLSGEGQEQQ